MQQDEVFNSYMLTVKDIYSQSQQYFEYIQLVSIFGEEQIGINRKYILVELIENTQIKTKFGFERQYFQKTLNPVIELNFFFSQNQNRKYF